MKKHRMVVLGVVLMVFTGSWLLAQEVRGNPKNGQAVYEKHCLRCHGASGDGLGPDATDLVVPPANFQSAKSRAKTDFELLIAISNGVLFSPMHGWRGRLNDTEMMDVIAYIRTFAPFLSISQTGPVASDAPTVDDRRG
ncbi:Cytochrome c [Nitrospira tepida]|uniref:Cytochrome c n=1 Tax=Nitrospira tepida TaxID=2973512 RepID=A0AA86TBG6_9BACT|nr:cytochrome c [Nitrospira tepida]CAI4033918.1 Cytochrome c [Nitrospira tepida]